MCAALLTFVCMLRYSEWNVGPIWFLYSSVLIVVRWADLIPVFFDIYGGTLGRSGPVFFDIYGDTLGRSGPVFFDIYGDTLGRSGPCILRYLW